jgi:hypothetical protein
MPFQLSSEWTPSPELWPELERAAENGYRIFQTCEPDQARREALEARWRGEMAARHT